VKADRKLPKRRIVRSVGTIPVAVQESAVGRVPYSATKFLIAFRAAPLRVSEGSSNSYGVPSKYVPWVR
jgi:hypothetical protein